MWKLNTPKLSSIKGECRGNTPGTPVPVSLLSSLLHEPESLLSHQVLAALSTPGREAFGSRTWGENTEQDLLQTPQQNKHLNLKQLALSNSSYLSYNQFVLLLAQNPLVSL